MRHRCISFFIMIGLSIFMCPIPHSLPQTVSAIPIKFLLSITSDWTRLSFYNLTMLNWSYHLTSGGNSAQLTYSVSSNSMAIGKRQYDETNVTLEIEALVECEGTDSSVVIEKGAIGNTILRIFSGEDELAIIINAGSVPGHEDLNPRSFDLTDILEGLKPRTMELSLKRALAKPMVLAFYYPWYGNAMGSSGMQFHWEEISYGGIGSSTFFPLLGPYDSQDEGLIEAHMEMAKASGIDGFVCSWWGVGTFEDRSFGKILQVAARLGFNVTAYYESVREMDGDQIVSELSYILSSYSDEPSFLRIGGRPVVFLYAVSAYGRDPRFWKDAIERVRGSTGVDALFIGDTFDASYAVAFDGFHTYNPIWMGEGEFARTYLAEAKSARVSGKIWAATVAPGYDDRKVRSPGTYVDGRGGAYYNLTWEASIRSDPDIILVCTWNEWHEGTNVEPSREFGFKYLLLTGHWTASFKDVSRVGPHDAVPSLTQDLSIEKGTLRLGISNSGNIDAVAVNAVLAFQNVSDWGLMGDVIYLPVNSTSVALFVPRIGANETLVVSMSFHDVGKVTFVACTFYYDARGNDYALKPVVASYEGGEIWPRDNFQIALVVGFIVLIVAIYLGFSSGPRRRRKD